MPVNRNHYLGKEIEELIQNSIINQAQIIRKLKEKFKISGQLQDCSGVGSLGHKADIRLSFTDGRCIDASIKGYKDNSGFNQLVRTTIAHFCSTFSIDLQDRDELESLVINKSKNPYSTLFTDNIDKWRYFFNTNKKKIIKWGLSDTPENEILICFNQTSSVVKIFSMEDIINNISDDIVFTKGGVSIGNCLSFQRKGGNGVAYKHISKHSIQHPGNQIQIKLKIHKLINELQEYQLAEYIII